MSSRLPGPTFYEVKPSIDQGGSFVGLSYTRRMVAFFHKMWVSSLELAALTAMLGESYTQIGHAFNFLFLIVQSDFLFFNS